MKHLTRIFHETPGLICFAHRGASGHAPENTMAAFQKAIDLGADWIELDVYAVENELVVIHDDRLDRTTCGKGRVTECSLDYIRNRDAGNGEKIPLLAEVLDLAGGRIKINIELKGPNTAIPAIRLIDGYIADTGRSYAEFLVSSFDLKQLQTARQHCQALPLAPNIKRRPISWKKIAGIIKPAAIHIDMGLASRQLINNIHARGWPVHVFTANTRPEIERLAAMGADGVFTNYPELITGVNTRP
ncbi:MAG: glycerophosphodiester phosphodiesterase family protein [Thermodesulfobacteriota bacterium]|nr:glycerophosphodiester phosphodiesterase family protein [Thermodesulfobacteriota bacterium]